MRSGVGSARGLPARARALRSHRLVRGVSVLATGSLVGQVITLGAAPIVARLYDPADFGLLAVITSITAILLSVSSLRYELAVPLPAQDATALDLVRLSLLLNTGTAALLALGTPWLGPALADAVDVPAVETYFWFVPAIVLVTGSYQAMSNWPVRVAEFGVLSRNTIAQAASQAACNIGLGAAGWAPAGLLVGSITGRGAGLRRLRRVVDATHPGWLQDWSGARLREAGSRYRRFPLGSTFVALLVAASLSLPPVLIAGLYGATVAGLFAVTTRLIATPMATLGSAVSAVFMSEAARMVREDVRALRRLFVRTTAMMLALATPPFVVFALAAPWLLGTVLGDEWVEAGHFARAVTPMFLCQFVASPPSHVLTVLERQGTQVVFSALKLLLGVAALAVSSGLGLSARAALTVYGLAMAASYVVFVLLCWLALRSSSRPLAPP